jgi:hypothetical protein
MIQSLTKLTLSLSFPPTPLQVIDYMVDKCGMSAQSRFIDVGSGLGKPNFHACQDPGVRISLGIELEEIRWQVS